MSNQVSIAKALKIKSRLAGELANLAAVIQTKNAVDSLVPNARKTALTDLGAYQLTLNQLIEVKSKISQANHAIYPKMERMNQLKAYLQMLSGINTTETKQDNFSQTGVLLSTRTITTQIKATWVDDEKKLIQKQVEELQDAIDEFNASTKLTLTF